VHWCDPDRYAGRWRFAPPGAWAVRWRVEGPRKAWTSLTLLERAG
jgi:hypothetical protein